MGKTRKLYLKSKSIIEVSSIGETDDGCRHFLADVTTQKNKEELTRYSIRAARGCNIANQEFLTAYVELGEIGSSFYEPLTTNLVFTEMDNNTSSSWIETKLVDTDDESISFETYLLTKDEVLDHVTSMLAYGRGDANHDDMAQCAEMCETILHTNNEFERETHLQVIESLAQLIKNQEDEMKKSDLIDFSYSKIIEGCNNALVQSMILGKLDRLLD